MTTIGGQILRFPGPRAAQVTPGVVTLADGIVKSIEFGAVPSTIDFGGPNHLVCPGFIDTHVHLPQFDSIGAVGMPLLPWLEQVIFPAEILWNDVDYARAMVSRVIDQFLSHGTTAVCAYATVSHEATVAAIEAFASAGFRGAIGQTLIDRGAPNELMRETDLLVDQVSMTLDAFPPAARMATAVTPRYALSCTEPLMLSAGQLAKDHDAIIQTHLAENTDECRLVSEAFGGARYVDVYENVGLLGPRSLFGHGIYLDDQDRRKLASSGSMIAHCPTANSFLSSGTMDRRSHFRSQLGMTLGSDIGAGYERSMVRVARAMIDAAMRLSKDPSHFPSAAEAWWQITQGNASAMGWTDVGRIEIGASADVLCIEPDIPWLKATDPLAMLLFAWDDRWIQQTFLQGRVSYQG